jgi:hypothetical protein
LKAPPASQALEAFTATTTVNMNAVMGGLR